MAGNILWQSGSVYSYGIQASGTGLQLNSGSAVVLSGTLLGVLDNRGASGGPALFAIAELQLAASGWLSGALARTTIDFYLVPSRDGVQFPDADVAGAVIPSNSYKGSFSVAKSGTFGSHMPIEGIPLMPLKYLGYIVNNASVMASGWGIVIDGYNEAYT